MLNNCSFLDYLNTHSILCALRVLQQRLGDVNKILEILVVKPNRRLPQEKSILDEAVSTSESFYMVRHLVGLFLLCTNTQIGAILSMNHPVLSFSPQKDYLNKVRSSSRRGTGWCSLIAFAIALV
jgi:hypothetical protein